MQVEYPFPESVIPQQQRLTLDGIPPYFRSSQYITAGFYPHAYSNCCVFMPGTTKEQWDDSFIPLYIWCCEHNICNILYVWSLDLYKHIQITNNNWQSLYPKPDNLAQRLQTEYGIGFCLPYYNTVRDTLLAYCGLGPFQMYVSPPNQAGKSSISKRIPSFNYDNIPAFDVIQDRQLRVYCHAALNMNICKFDESDYIAKLLNYCTAHGIKSAVFHVGTNKDIPIDDALKMMAYNIITGISKFTAKGPTTCKFLLETPAGEGNEVLADGDTFIDFCMRIKALPGIGEHFDVCIDTCHVFQAGYCPYSYLKQVMNYLPVGLVHFNDAEKGWGCRRDLHAVPGNGLIPWYYLLKVAQLCKSRNIDMIFE